MPNWAGVPKGLPVQEMPAIALTVEGGNEIKWKPRTVMDLLLDNARRKLGLLRKAGIRKTTLEHIVNPLAKDLSAVGFRHVSTLWFLETVPLGRFTTSQSFNH